MERGADEAAGDGDLLALEHVLAERHTGFGGRTKVLRQRQNQALGQWRRLDRGAVGQLLVLWRMDAAVDVPYL